MADELNIQAQFQFNKDNAALNGTVQATHSVSLDNYTELTQEVTTTSTVFEYGSVDQASVGFVMVQNIGEHDIYIKFQDPGEEVLKLLAGTATQPGGIFMGYAADSEIDGFQVFLRADTAASRVTIRLISA